MIGSQYAAILTGLGLFAVAAALFAAVQWAAPGIVGNDGYYHIKMAYLIRQEGLTPAFEALPHTILNAEAYYDHHLLFHLFLVPFAGVDPAADGGAGLTQGAKLATVILPALGVVAVWWLLRGRGVPYASLWAMGLFVVSEAFLYRMSMARAQSGAIIFLALALHWLLSGRHKWLAPLGFLFVWFYNAFPLLLVMVGVYVVAVLLLERRVAWSAIVYPIAGIVLGLLINPYFPQNVTFIAGHLLPKVGESVVPVGNEWSPYQTWTLVENSGVALAAVLLGALAVGWREERIDLASLVGLGLVGVFGLMLFKSRRFVEYFPMFALLFLAFASAPLLHQWRAAERLRRRWPRTVVAGTLGLVFAAMIYTTIGDARNLVAGSKPADLYADAMLYLREVAPDGATIFQTDWDDFTRQFFYFDRARYINGLDPTFMQLHDEALYEAWVDITRGRVDAPGAAIRDQFGADYVFSDLEHESFIEIAAGDPLLREVFRDEYAVIYYVVADQQATAGRVGGN
ncbi:MAG: hypothetical protein KA170_00440 [Candidatus Promineofilum sp.]|nr:hypothetical protein [Promineifilum sp.]